MKSICCYCGKVLKPGEGEISDGICPKCLEKMLKEIDDGKHDVSQV